MAVDVLKVCDEIDAAGKKATPRPWHDVLDLDVFADDGDYALLAANHVQELTKLVRRLVADFRDARDWGPKYGSLAGAARIQRLAEALECDYPGLLASPPEAGRLEGGNSTIETLQPHDSTTTWIVLGEDGKEIGRAGTYAEACVIASHAGINDPVLHLTVEPAPVSGDRVGKEGGEDGD